MNQWHIVTHLTINSWSCVFSHHWECRLSNFLRKYLVLLALSPFIYSRIYSVLNQGLLNDIQASLVCEEVAQICGRRAKNSGSPLLYHTNWDFSDFNNESIINKIISTESPDKAAVCWSAQIFSTWFESAMLWTEKFCLAPIFSSGSLWSHFNVVRSLVILSRARIVNIIGVSRRFATKIGYSDYIHISLKCNGALP